MVHLRTSRALVSCLKRPLKVLWNCADVTRNWPTLHTCVEEDHLFQCKFTSQWTVHMHKNTCIGTSVFIVWELKELTGRIVSCLKRALKVLWKCADVPRNSPTLQHMRRRRSPVPMQVYIPVNSSICIRTLKKVYSSCESWKSLQSIVSCLRWALKVLWKCADVPRNSPTLHTCAEGDHLFQCKFTSQGTVLYA